VARRHSGARRTRGRRGRKAADKRVVIESHPTVDLCARCCHQILRARVSTARSSPNTLQHRNSLAHLTRYSIRNNTLTDLKSAKNRPPWRLAYPARNVDWPCRAICRMLFAEGRVSLAFGDAQISFREARTLHVCHRQSSSASRRTHSEASTLLRPARPLGPFLLTRLRPPRRWLAQ